MNNKLKLLFLMIKENKHSYDTEDIQQLLALEVVNSIYPIIKPLTKEGHLNKIVRGKYELNDSSESVRTIRTFYEILGQDTQILFDSKTKTVLKTFAEKPELKRNIILKKIGKKRIETLLKAKIVCSLKRKKNNLLSLCPWEESTSRLLDFFQINCAFNIEEQRNRILKTISAETTTETSEEDQLKIRLKNEEAYLRGEDYVLNKLETTFHELSIIDVMIEQKKSDHQSIFGVVGKVEEWKVRYVYNTDKIEGNPLTYDEVMSVLTSGEDIGHSPKGVMETTNSQRALNHVFDTKNELSEKFILHLHKITQQQIEQRAGKYKNTENCVVNSERELIDTTTPVAKVQERMKQLIDWYNKHKKEIHPIALASVIHNQFVYIHPFADGNGRVARLLMNFILIKNDYYPFIIPNEEKEKYYSALRLGKTGDMKPFMMFLVDLLPKQLKYF